ncbi:hypothetical protein AWRI1631_70940 [Saccharomyces cerevisiae AWRI1631]|uniref:Uncharacterized protein n=1 Tax=Saccharomyces cerevisiae (strain AWRI1631) TaxID=545124 RepID=B5VIH0_YEAS6|nr:hypothetical protein AWRI1631_70940 [Saccharomyces cerevisiae AWRI1631]
MKKFFLHQHLPGKAFHFFFSEKKIFKWATLRFRCLW